MKLSDIQNFLMKPWLLAICSASLLLACFAYTPLNPAALAYCIFLSGALVILGRRLGVAACIIAIIAYLLAQHFWLQDYLSSLQLESQFVRTLLYVLVPGLLFLGVSRHQSNDRAIILTLATLLIAIVVSSAAIKLFVAMRPNEVGLGEGLAIFFIAVGTFLLVSALGLLYGLSRR